MMQDTLPDRMEKEMEGPLNLAHRADVHGEALWRNIVYALVEEESTPIPNIAKQNTETWANNIFILGTSILRGLDPLYNTSKSVDAMDQQWRYVKEQPEKSRRMHLSETRRILTQLSLQEKIMFLQMFREKGLEKTVRHWEENIRDRIVLGVVKDPRFKY